ncbi:MAG: hypoxanthine phosphoribosyltransferase [Eubacteriales bacterium]|nr:hypoxanthine phosphoribosyltransferase [Eubacteriales bacterium]MDD4475815.1 hypoxanthine phosphoribosyltransferase [Eubacteriales bacterium]
MNLESNIASILISEEQIKDKISEIAKQISIDYEKSDLLMVGVLKGSMVFMSDLMRAMNINTKIDFMCVSSYGASTKTSGQVRILMDLREPIDGKDVLIIEDILDSGVTLSYLVDVLRARNPKSIAVCTLLDKPSRRKSEVQLKYRGFVIPDEFVVGYGLDYAEDYRNLPYIGVLKPEVYEI